MSISNDFWLRRHKVDNYHGKIINNKTYFWNFTFIETRIFSMGLVHLVLHFWPSRKGSNRIWGNRDCYCLQNLKYVPQFKLPINFWNISSRLKTNSCNLWNAWTNLMFLRTMALCVNFIIEGNLFYLHSFHFNSFNRILHNKHVVLLNVCFHWSVR